MATPWPEEFHGLLSMGSQRVGRDRATFTKSDLGLGLGRSSLKLWAFPPLLPSTLFLTLHLLTFSWSLCLPVALSLVL